ncbi:MAG TPA: endo-1,4-beta-xylanase [Fibrobacteria bacterium]|nr:endo-1,4-beta-xylanase [Fibrobacteria bacterium]HOX50402.1 endo-1,4-beta-xylanase [Fibrobacteria bacterium]
MHRFRSSAAKFVVVSFLVFSAAESRAQIAKGACKFLGNISEGNPVASYNTYWNQMSPENAGKWGSVQSSATSSSYNWSKLDAIAAWAKKTGNPWKFHVLVWGQQQPGDANSASYATILRWFQAVHTRYPDVDMIDVVNEAFPSHAPAGYKGVLDAEAKKSGYTGEFAWIFQAFKMARALWPKAILIYNDYNNIEYNSENTWQVNFCKAAKAQNVPIDAIGVQAHDAFKLKTADVKAKIDAIAATGFPVYVTEYDIGHTDDNQQKNVMADQMPMFWTHPKIAGVTYWGITVGQTWRSGTGLESASGVARPSLTWLKEYIPKNLDVPCPTSGLPSKTTLSDTRHGSASMVVRQVDGRLVTGVERDGRFQELSALGRN